MAYADLEDVKRVAEEMVVFIVGTRAGESPRGAEGAGARRLEAGGDPGALSAHELRRRGEDPAGEGQRNPVGRRFRRHRRDAAERGLRPAADGGPLSHRDQGVLLAARPGAAGGGAGRGRAGAGGIRRDHRRRPAHPRSGSAAASASRSTSCRRKPSTGTSTCASTARCRTAVSAWASSGAWRGSAGWSTCARPSRFRACSTGCGREIRCEQSHIAIIGAPLDLGQGRRGVDMGPSALRVANLNKRIAALGYEVEDLGNVPVEQAESLPAGPAATPSTCRRSRRPASGWRGWWSRRWRTGECRWCWAAIIRWPSGRWPACRMLSARKKQEIGLIWVDAHADMNTPETSPSGNVHGMPLACCVGMGPRELTHLLGYAPRWIRAKWRSWDCATWTPWRSRTCAESGVRAFTMRDIDERGLRAVMQDAIRIASEGTAGFHLSLDMDFVDPQHAPGVGTPVRGGATYREAHLAMEMICDSARMVSMEVVEVNPVIDEVNRTADLASGTGHVRTGEADSMKRTRGGSVWRAQRRARDLDPLGQGHHGRHGPRQVRDCRVLHRQGRQVESAADPARAGGASGNRRGFSGAARHVRRRWHGAGPAGTGGSALRGGRACWLRRSPWTRR